jgi:DNA-binding HxlR family transcriptional regulator
VSDLAAALDIVGARWALLVVERLLDGPQRYGDLQRDLGVPTNMLATRLRELEAAGVLTRLPLRHNTRAYALTDRGLALREAIVALGRWGAEELVGGPDTPSKVTVSFDLGSREAVDELVDRAGAAGGRIGDIDDYPFMYQRQFDDPDGYHYSPFWMKPDAQPIA